MACNQSHRSYRFAGATSFLAAALWFSLASMAPCQEAAGPSVPGGVIEGEVRDPAGLPVSGASMTIRNTLTGYSLQRLTDDVGRYSFAGVRPGRYWVVAS
ncbi:MAG: carboxypeptidase regulatory-like domain-containing protein, partial [Acidobacteria bacterium]|nr:carboxypeptidase regulatory-like domain-containing protein [Acidobacteriota bacterium]